MLPSKNSGNQEPWNPDTGFIALWDLGTNQQMAADGQVRGFQNLPQQKTEGGGKQVRPPRKRRVIITAISISLVILIGGGVLAAVLLQNLLNPAALGQNLLATPPTIQVAIDEQAINALIAKNLKLPQNVISGLNVVPLPDNGLQINLNLIIDASGIHRVIPIEIDATIGGNSLQGLSLTIQHVKRGGVDAGPTIAANMQATLSQFLKMTMPASASNQPTIRLTQLGTIEASASRACGHGAIVIHASLQMKLQDRVIPVGIDGFLGMNEQHILLFHLDRITHDGGQDVDASITTKARQLVDQSIGKAPAFLDKQPVIQKIKLLSLNTRAENICGKNSEMLVLTLGAPPAGNTPA